MTTRYGYHPSIRRRFDPITEYTWRTRFEPLRTVGPRVYDGCDNLVRDYGRDLHDVFMMPGDREAWMDAIALANDFVATVNAMRRKHRAALLTGPFRRA